MKRLQKLLGAGVAATLLSCLSPAQATMITFDLSPFTGDPSTLRITLDDAINANFITLTATVVQPPIADIRGIFFNLIDDPGLTTSDITGADVTEVQTNTADLGNGANINPAGPFDFGIEIGTQGIGGNDIQTTTVLIDDLAGELMLADFGSFAGRLTSVADPNCSSTDSRCGSSKLSGTPRGPNPPTGVPEPATVLLFGTGLLIAGLIGIRAYPGGTEC